MSEGLKGKKNIYVCTMGHHTVTIDVDEGTTPMKLLCKQREDGANRNCTCLATSKFYQVDQSLEPEYEWYRPTDMKKLSKTEREHVKLGGLLLRKIKKYQPVELPRKI